jgi:hypothetical protein
MQAATSTLHPRFVFTLTTLLLLGLAVPAWPGDTPAERATLKGIPAMEVRVEPLDPQAEFDGLRRDQLQTEVEARLRQAGITVTSPSGEGERSPYLYLNVNTFKNDIVLDQYAFNIQLEFNQRVILERNRNVSLSAPTWSISAVGIVSAQRLRHVRDMVADDVDQFIKVYLEQNPKP